MASGDRRRSDARRAIGRGTVAAALAFWLAACTDVGGNLTSPSVSPLASPYVSAQSPRAPIGTAGAGATPTPVAVPSHGTWTKVEVVGPVPAAREDHTLIVAEDGTAYLFGGRDGGKEFDDLWAFDPAGGTWRRVDVSGEGPAARFGHEALWAAGRGLVVWAGQAGTGFFDDLWLFDPARSSWRRLPSDGQAPTARYGSCSGIGPDGRLWISHGFTEDGVRFADTRAYDFEAGRWADEAPAGTGPKERCLHACWWTQDGRFVLYGGQTTGVPALGDLWSLTPGGAGGPSNAWTEAADQGLAARQLAAFARPGALTVVFGGRGVDRKPLDDTWLLADDERAFERLQTSGRPAARSGGAMVVDSARGRLLLFGGLADDELGDLWSLTFR